MAGTAHHNAAAIHLCMLIPRRAMALHYPLSGYFQITSLTVWERSASWHRASGRTPSAACRA
jgi:hypothetical protein